MKKGYRRILVAVDDPREILEQGLELAQDEKCWVTVVKVVPPNEGDLSLVGIKDIRTVLDGKGEKDIADVKAIADRERALVKTRLEEGEAPQRIAELAEEEHCDLIIMGYKGGKGIAAFFRRLFSGNPIERLISMAPCPVLVLKT
jgi:nucleotide-binding universal stress UspA family protein